MQNSVKLLMFAFMACSMIFLSGCTEEDEKELTGFIINKTLGDLNPIKHPSKNNTVAPAANEEKCDDSFYDRFDCRYEGSGYAVVKNWCSGGIKQKTIFGPSYEYCNDYGEYVRQYCDDYTIREIKAEVNTVCLSQNAKVGKEYCRNGQIKRDITDCETGSACVVTDGIAKCAKIEKPDYGDHPLRECSRDSKGRCPGNCVEYYGRCVYPA